MSRQMSLGSAAFLIALGTAAVAAPPPVQVPSQQGPHPVARATVAGQLDSAFAAADTNHDGSLSIAELQALQTKELQQVTANLRAQLQARFKQLDTNKDGQLSFQEFLASVGEVRSKETPAQILQSYDTNHDGKVSPAEFRAPRLAQFDRLDANHDGTLTPAEELAGNRK